MKKQTFIIVLIVVVIVTAFILWPKKPKAMALPGIVPDGNAGSGGGGGGGSDSAAASNKKPGLAKATFPLVQGSRGEEVKNVQRAINYNNSYFGSSERLAEDGVFGPATLQVVIKSFPNDKGIISKSRYDWIMQRYNSGVPLSIRYVKKNQWPLVLGDSVSDPSDTRLRVLNIGLGVFRFDTKDGRVNQFTKETLAALKGAAGIDKVGYREYARLANVFHFAPGFLN